MAAGAAVNLVARLGLNTTGFRAAATQVGKTAGKHIAEGAATTAGAFGMQAILERIFGGTSRAAKTQQDRKGGPTMYPMAGGMGTGGAVASSGVRAGVAGIVAAGVAGAGWMAKKGHDAVDEIKDLSEQSDLSVENVQRLSRAANRSGKDFSHFSRALDQVGMSRQDAVEGNDKLLETFKRYGVTLKDLQDPSKDSLDILKMLGNAMAGMEISPRMRNDLRDLGGKTLPSLRNALQDIDKVGGGFISEQTAANVDKLNRRLAEMKERLAAIGANLLTGPIAKGIDHVLGKLGDSRLGRLAGQKGKDLLALAGIRDETPLEKKFRLDIERFKREQAEIGDARNKKLFEETEAQQKEKELKKEIEEINFRGLEDPEKKKALEKKITELSAARAAFTPGDSVRDKVKLLEFDRDIADKRVDLKELTKGDPLQEKRDDLARIGGFSGLSGVASEKLERIAKATEETARKIQQDEARRDRTGIRGI